MRVIALLPLLAACHDAGFSIHNATPSVSLTAPVEGAVYDQNTAIFLEGEVWDDGPLDELHVDWLSSIAGVLEEDTEIQVDGSVSFVTSNLAPGDHTLVLRAIDGSAENDEATVTITVIPVPERPSITVLHPDVLGDEKGLENNAFVFMASVSDRQSAPEDLVVELVATPFGLVCTMSPDGSGTAQCPAILPLGSYNLTFTVTDVDDNEAIANAPFAVVTRNDYDMDGDGYSPNGGDCNDSNATIYPGAPEICDGMDNDCIDVTPIDVNTDCYDDDGDGYCERPPCVNCSGTLADCDDTNAARYPDPSVPEIVNGFDDDCDGTIDEGTVVYDDDGDGYCENPPCVNSTRTQSDCDDGNPEVNPGEDEVCGDGFDNDCNGLSNEQDAIGCTSYYLDEDGDTYGVRGATECWCAPGSYPYTGVNTTDCYDDNADAWPGQTSYFASPRGDGSYDYNCDGAEEFQYSGFFGRCSWSFEPFTCEIGAEGWDETRTPRCGASGTWVEDCDGTYDVVCMFLCAYTDPTLCTHCWDCEADASSQTQACR